MTNYKYEIPKENGMLVPAIVFANEKLFEKIKEDRTIVQLKNMATLPGIIKNAIALPDAHSGYGFPIGGVAAFDLDKGVVSPGGVGYDINCLSGNSKILSSLGYWKNIKDFENENKDSLIILDKDTKKMKNSEIALFMKKPSEKIIKLKTKSGEEILATSEHPIYTKYGMKELKDINPNEEILTYPFEGVKHEKANRKLLISEEDINKLNKSPTSKIQIKNILKKLDLLPLYTDNNKLPIILKIMGFIFGDGNLSIKKNTQTSFYGDIEDLTLIKEDLDKIGFKSHLFSRKRNHKITTQYKKYEFSRIEHSLHNGSSALATLFYLLGTPEGNKAEKDYDLPDWILNSPRWHQRLFLASLFGAEMSSPKTMSGHSFNLYGLVFSINKRNSLHGINFVNKISTILNNFGVRNVLIKNDVNEINSTTSFRTRLMIYSDSENLIRFFSEINYDYNIKKRKLANAAIVWLKLKEKVIKFREETIIKARDMKLNGIGKSVIINSLSSEYSNKYFIDKAVYYSNYGQTGSRIAFCFPTFNEFVEKNCYGEQGFIWDTVENKEEIIHNDWVYDFTINNPNRNFIANGLVVSNCSVRILKTNLTFEDIKGKEKLLTKELFKATPNGVGSKSKLILKEKEINEVLEKGLNWCLEKGFATKEDIECTEDSGCLPNANPKDVSQKARGRGIPQLGTLGAGNHFVELQLVDKIINKEIAKEWGLKEGQVTIMIHCGSRGLGHQVASDYIQLMEQKYGWPKQDRELVNAPIKSELGQKYLSAMACAANFGFANKQLITNSIREAFKKIFPKFKAEVVYDVCHNIAKTETHKIDGKDKKVLIMRKGATRSFGPGRKELPLKYQKTGQPVLIPGSMGTSSYILVGTKESEELSFSSTAHGAGRVSSRSFANKNITAESVEKQLNQKGVTLEAGSKKGIVEEAPEVYKDIDEVVEISDKAGLAKIVAKLRPVCVIKG
jgi:tRNA-splicing ligase RtcB (3'-phosphate/5'-hydroxy nucleic acid ligase)